jgi:hypothetical protein
MPDPSWPPPPPGWQLWVSDDEPAASGWSSQQSRPGAHAAPSPEFNSAPTQLNYGLGSAGQASDGANRYADPGTSKLSSSSIRQDSGNPATTRLGGSSAGQDPLSPSTTNLGSGSRARASLDPNTSKLGGDSSGSEYPSSAGRTAWEDSAAPGSSAATPDTPDSYYSSRSTPSDPFGSPSRPVTPSDPYGGADSPYASQGGPGGPYAGPGAPASPYASPGSAGSQYGSPGSPGPAGPYASASAQGSPYAPSSPYANSPGPGGPGGSPYGGPASPAPPYPGSGSPAGPGTPYSGGSPYSPYSGGPAAPYGPPASGTSGFAVSSLVLGIFGIFGITAVLSAIFGFVGLSKIRRTGQGGKGLAIAGIVLSAAWVIVLISLGVAGSHQAQRSANGQINKGGSLSVLALKSGDCFVYPSDQSQINSVTAIPCGQPHDAQVFAQFNLTGSSSSYPSNMTQLASNGCQSRTASLNKSLLTDAMSMKIVYPQNASWVTGNRTVNCVMYSPSNLSTSLLNS